MATRHQRAGLAEPVTQGGEEREAIAAAPAVSPAASSRPAIPTGKEQPVLTVNLPVHTPAAQPVPEDSDEAQEESVIPIRLPDDHVKLTPGRAARSEDEESRAEASDVARQLDQASNGNDSGTQYELPPVDLMEDPEPFPYEQHTESIRAKARLLEETIAEFGYQVKVVQIDTGPVVTQYEIELEAGLRVGKIHALADDLAIALKAPAVRIVAPLPKRDTVGVEVPNDQRASVRIKRLCSASRTKPPR
jgi:S-DNA-T family DNA segregation ATPase FtsK/SpoIIIE